MVRLGVAVNELIEKAGGLPEDTGKVISGEYDGKSPEFARSSCRKRHIRHTDNDSERIQTCRNSELYPMRQMYYRLSDGSGTLSACSGS